MVILLDITPSLLVSYLTVIVDDSPGMIASFGKVGTVHPQLALASVIKSGALPVFLKLNVLVGSDSLDIMP